MPPNSSAIAEKIKSCTTTGIFSGSPLYNPSPSHPPVPIANKDCPIWYPSFSITSKGELHASTRILTCANS